MLIQPTKLCCIFNTPSLYRERIYALIDQKYDCDWVFEDTNNNLKEFDTSKLHRVSRLHTFKIGPFYWVSGLLQFLYRHQYSQYLMMGHSRNLSTLIFLLIKKIFFPSKKVYLWTHGIYGKESKLEHLYKTLLYKCSDKVLVYGDYSCSLMKNMGFDVSRLYAIHNSLDFDTQLQIRQSLTESAIYESHFQNRSPVIVFIGRLNPVKKLDMIIKAVSELKRQGKIFNLALIGDGPTKDSLKNLVCDLKLDKQVWFYGASYDEKKNAELIYNADICVAPGNIGLTAMHVMMFGCPAISHNCFKNQMPEFEAIKEGLTGDFFEYNNQDSLTNTIAKWFSHPDYNRDSIRQNCYDEIDKNWSTTYQLNILSQVIQ